ncbi:leucine rich repeat protein [Elysia marginata]|uniref:Leucine rich repeat protein n=1 Tax=Elysia marginata TaxID=1093978 RepID=A0AAV4HNZ9_9GAST|nr:leucine rich repeat protein [Elysia marginata]
MAVILQRLVELWNRVVRSKSSFNDDFTQPYTDFQCFVEYLDGEKRENALKVGVLSVIHEKPRPSTSPPEIPVAIGHFNQLTSLQVKGCNLTSIPWSFVYLKKLVCLDLSDNRLQYLPSFIGSLANLQRLNVENNQLLVLPTALLQLSRLSVILLTGNQSLQSPDYAVCQKGLKAILQTISQRGVHVNAWAGCKLAGAFTPFYSREVPTLFSLASSTITSSSIDFLSVGFVPPRLKTFLIEEKKFEIKVAKCSMCKGFFSNNVMLEAHICKRQRS